MWAEVVRVTSVATTWISWPLISASARPAAAIARSNVRSSAYSADGEMAGAYMQLLGVRCPGTAPALG